MKNIIEKTKKYYTDARQRATRRKSPWNILLVIFSMVAWFGIWGLIFKLVWLFHITIYPSHEFKDFWRKGISFRTLILSFLMVFSIMPGAQAIAGILTNVLFYLLPWSRRVFESEARGHTGTDFGNAMRKLFKFFIWSFPLGLMISFLAAYFLQSLR